VHSNEFLNVDVDTVCTINVVSLFCVTNSGCHFCRVVYLLNFSPLTRPPILLAENGPEVMSDGARFKTETLPLKYQNIILFYVDRNG